MSNLLDIVFQTGDFFNQDDSNFWENLLGAFVGAATALIIFYLETRREAKKTESTKSEEANNTLEYFSSLLSAIILFAEKQYPAYENHAKNLKEKPLEYHLLRKIIADDLNRILNRMDHEKLFHSYTNRFGNSKEKIKTFQKIFSELDYIYSVYNYANNLHENHISDLTDRLIKYKEIAEEKALNYCSFLGNNIRHTNADYKNDSFYIALNNAVVKYYETAPEPMTIIHIQEQFINPIKMEIITKFSNIDKAVEIADYCRKATWLYNESIEKSKGLAIEFEGFSQGLKRVTNDLKINASDLLNPEK